MKSLTTIATLALAFTVNACGVNNQNSRPTSFQPQINIGSGMFIAPQDCRDLNILAKDRMTTVAEFTRFELLKFTKAGTTTLIRLAIPRDASYVFTGPAGIQSTNTLITNSWEGSEGFQFIGRDGSGDLDIVHVFADGTKRTCHLKSHTGAGIP